MQISVPRMRWSLLLASALMCPLVSGAAERVILISVDGLRADAIDAADTPAMHRMIAEGAHHPYALCDLPSSTLPNHTSMVTGVYADTHGVWLDFELEGSVNRETIFSIAHQAGLTCGFFAGKDKLGYLAPEEIFLSRWIIPDMDELHAAVLAALDEGISDLLFIHYRAPDSAGHQSGWMSPEYLQAVARVDTLVGQLLDKLTERSLLNGTVVILTADHGGVGEGHALNVPEVRQIPWIAWGAGIAPGRTLCQEINQPDTPATVLALLGVPVPSDFEGRVVEEAFAETSQAACEPAVPLIGPPCVVLMIPLMMVAIPTLQARVRQLRFAAASRSHGQGTGL